MPHETIFYRNTINDLSHLDQRSYDFSWTEPDYPPFQFKVWVRYSPHCYSRQVDPDEAGPDDVLVYDPHHTRVFCPERYIETPRLVEIINSVMSKPTTRVSTTTKGNQHVFQLFIRNGSSQRYCVFFSLKNSDVQPIDGSSHYLDAHIESAYVKDERVGVVTSMPFGRLAHHTKKNIRYR
ncbi:MULTISPECIES: hypothetical protein [unclassified Rhizobium]|uniref:hypothetical protein n=1 Tax=unclassified Rhizobium TaxID=2613769 RepID=UPI000AD06E5F|nr:MULTISPECIES: hypothetical protein [unclassified Rhizobium]